MATIKLKNCLNCKIVKVQWDSKSENEWAVKCQKCGSMTGYCESMSEAINQWDRINTLKKKPRSKKTDF